MKSRYIGLGVILLGASIEFALCQVRREAFWGGFELPPWEDGPPLISRLMWLWVALSVALPGLVVGLLVKRHAGWLSGTSYFLGVIADFCYHDGEHQVPHRFLPGLERWPSLLRSFLIVALVGALVGLIAAWFRRRLTIGWSDRGAHLR